MLGPEPLPVLGLVLGLVWGPGRALVLGPALVPALVLGPALVLALVTSWVAPMTRCRRLAPELLESEAREMAMARGQGPHYLGWWLRCRRRRRADDPRGTPHRRQIYRRRFG
ncbi:hypothetical protein [Arthrobacter sp. HLT1-21]